ncbi:MAG: hypothetical protein H7222_17895 [Methylotenera sp.]|nr:hypothetical protein [Oligoflexia bacterium]
MKNQAASLALAIASISAPIALAQPATPVVAPDAHSGVQPPSVHLNEVKEPAHAKPSESLPRVIKTAPVTLKSATVVQVRFVPPKHWKINDGAPTWFALFETTHRETKLIREYPRSEVKTLQVELPMLEAGHVYRAQGTFYICQEKGGSVCLMQSADQKITISPQGQDSFEIQLSQAE